MDHETDPHSADQVGSSVKGHNTITAMLAQAMASGRMHHAWLLTGAKGIGKATTARLAAARLLSDALPSAGLFGDGVPTLDLTPDDAGANLVLAGAHPDFVDIRPSRDDNKSGQIKIEQIRDLIPFMAHKPARGAWRVAIVDSLDDVNRNGANALLKVVEEPPEKTVIFLISSRPGRLPPTIRSRCRLVHMARLGDDDCRDVLEDIWPDGDSAHIDLLARLCDGAPGRAVQLAETGAVDLYQVACHLLAAPVADVPAMANLTGKWGRGGSDGRLSREAAVFCLDRLLYHAALQGLATDRGALTDFEMPAKDALAARHSPLVLAEMHRAFIHDSGRADGVYLDFSQFLLRQLIKMHEKTLP
jgi:DNA polymerase-3 subunit delta'